MKAYPLRFKPGQDLKVELLNFAHSHAIKAAVIATCVGSLSQAHLRLAGAAQGKKFKGPFEILSLVGTFSENHLSHFHIALADSEGHTLGGHLLDQNIILTTAEVLVLEIPEYVFSRELDPQTGYLELEPCKA